ncbi:MAG: hypothetical protein K2N51_07020 [Lachnospiraceae bacterium]|nr:hypothetical protein [Lachnospiraceae bacterium]
MDLPIPTHLQQYFIPIGDKNSEYEVTGTIQCSCGSEKFQIWESDECHIIKGVCNQCGQEILLFDAGKHGWNGFVCNDDFVDRTLPFRRYNCPKCNRDIYSITIYISSQGKEDFLEECVSNDNSFSIDDWIDGFEWIEISLSCGECDFIEKDWVSFETM